ncbi:Epoxide hydrolase 4-like 1 [Homarus americanus]|uniref:Epoxide hydrolase 4-like 1 n=1 Tax=Homarus americanus TaxID=6706 RepID=A0A8J5JQT5_HOMAM|nr:Epoxide hydrolase 4-like 1 [Homarus americanus]
MWDCVRVNLSAATDTVWAALRWLTLALVEWTLAVVYGVLMLGKLVWAWSRGALHPPFVRVVPPQCLHDPLLGRHKFIKLQNMKLHYVEAGSPFNPLLVMIHGAPDFWFTWRRQIPALSHDYWVVAVDMRGCGDSDTPRLRTQYTTALLADDVAHLIRLLGQTSAHLMCAGVGGQVGWHMCYHYPQLVSKMVLIHCPHPYVIRHMVNTLWMNYYKSWYLWFVRLPFLPEMAAQVNDVGLVDRLFSSLVKNKTITEEELEAYKFTFSRREYVERITIKPIPGGVYLSHLSHASQVNQMVGEFLREMPWRPLSPLETPQSSSLVGRVMGASLAAVTSTVSKTSGALDMTKSLPGGFMNMAQASFKVAESKLGLENLY